REQTLNRLLECVLKERVILVHSPPMTGKTALTQLFEHYLLQSRSRVFRISLLWMERSNSSWTFEKRFEDLMKMTWDGFLDQCGKETFLIVDEVQKIYKPENEDEPHHGGKVFWDQFKRIMQSTSLHIVAFASYGHYGAYTVDGDHAIMDISPYRLPKSNAWGFADVCFTEEEFHDYFDHFCEKNLEMLQKEDTPLLSHYVSAITAFHPGLVAFTMEKIHARFVKHTFKSLTFAKVFAYLKSRDFNAHFMDVRAMPRITYMSDAEKKLVDTVLFKKGGLKIKTSAIPHEGRIIKTNILVDTAMTTDYNHSILDFPAPLLRATYLQNRFGSVTRSKSPPNTFRDFITLVFAKMDPKVLQKSKGTGVDGRLLERVWQMEFYRASMQVLPEDVHASVDAGAVFGSKGYIDFYINDHRNWAIELLRDGDKLEQHQKRFQEGGIYIPILKYAKEGAVIDIRNNKKGFPEGHGKDDIYVLCAENFESVQLMYPDGTKEVVQLLGKEEDLLGYNISEFLEDSMETD
ncbi:4989_t:CDS:2, partial [Paraglomus brasilianum]